MWEATRYCLFPERNDTARGKRRQGSAEVVHGIFGLEIRQGDPEPRTQTVFHLRCIQQQLAARQAAQADGAISLAGDAARIDVTTLQVTQSAIPIFRAVTENATVK